MPAPRRVRRAPYVQFSAPLAWTTLALTLRADGTSSFAMTGASSFPRHWVYGGDNKLALKSGMIDFSQLVPPGLRQAQPLGRPGLPGAHHRGGDRPRAPALGSRSCRAAPSPRSRPSSRVRSSPSRARPRTTSILVLDGVVRIEVDGERLAEYGPGSMHGERAVLEGGRRTSTIRAVTACKLAVAGAEHIDRDALAELSSGHRREEQG